MSKRKPKASMNDIDWGISNWEDEKAYPDPKVASKQQWAWEFLRRRKEYRDDWLIYSSVKDQLPKGNINANSTITFSFGEGNPVFETGDHPIWEEQNPARPSGWDGWRSYAMKKYGILGMTDPRNPNPLILPFPELKKHELEYHLGEGGIHSHWGMEYTLHQSEITLRIDLNTYPVESLMHALFNNTELYEENQDSLDSGPEYHHSLEERDANTISSLKILWKEGKKLQTTKDNHHSTHSPRIVADPRYRGIVHLILDRTLPFGAQWKTAKRGLQDFQERNVGEVIGKRAHPFKWRDYLRILDARETPQANGKPATYEVIGNVVLGIEDYGDAKSMAKQNHEAALKLLETFPY